MKKKNKLTDSQELDAKRLKALYQLKRSDLGINQEIIAEALESTQGAVSHYLNGVNALNPKAAAVFAKVLRVNIADFSPSMADEVNKLTSGMDETEESRRVKKGTYKIDVLDIQASAGCGVALRDEFIETIMSIEYTNSEARELFAGRPAKNIKMITVKGDSMAGTLNPRDQIFIDVSVNYFDGDGIYIFVLDNVLYVKRLQLQHKRIAVISDNKTYETWHIDKDHIDDMRIVAKVLLSQSMAYKRHE